MGVKTFLIIWKAVCQFQNNAPAFNAYSPLESCVETEADSDFKKKHRSFQIIGIKE